MLLDAFTVMLEEDFDVAMPLLNGLDAARQLKATRRTARLIFLTMNPDPDLASEALRLGAPDTG